MDNEKAKIILSAYRPDGSDASDVAFADALDQVRNDPNLEQWFKAEQEFDQAIGDKLKAITVPAHLKSSILAGAHLDKDSATRNYWALPAIAALIAVFVLVGSMLLPKEESDTFDVAGYREAMTQHVAGPVMLNHKDENIAVLREWLRDNAMPHGEYMPVSFESNEGIGCKVIDWNGHKVSLICMRAGDQVVHMFVTDAATCESLKSTPEFESMGEWASAMWKSEDQVYMVVSRTSEEQLKQYL